ncbi:hypothetical protein SteCoe_21732 [Stentor coeruleus]|uniref:Uncharacterized protein n=1 Tax=Stentor coeruleus TaxID=5963 RepID=A0A1R2BNU6_9CILI|nr:hypothetical protein SteCoe_21732 [Stentor coeruleus]
MSDNGNCYICSGTEAVFNFCCGHKACISCLIDFCFYALKSFYRILENDLDLLSGKASGLGCPLFCKTSQLSLSLRYISKFLDKIPILNENDRDTFKKVTDIGLSFFSGIKTYFSRCNICKNIFPDLKKNLHICKPCIKALFKIQLNLEPTSFSINWQRDFELFRSETNFEKITDFILVPYDEYSKTYFYEENSEQNIFYIMKLNQSNIFSTCLIIRAFIIENNRIESPSVMVRTHQHVQTIARINNLSFK